MTNVNDLLEAAANADRAGDSEAARLLVQEAEKFMAPPVTGPQAPPRADAPGGGATPRVDNFGDTIRDTIEGPWQATKAFAGGLADQSQSPTMNALPAGTPGPLKRPLAAVGDLAMTGLSAMGTGIALGAGVVGETFGGSPTNERKLARDLMGAAEVAVPELSGVSSTARIGAKAARIANAPQKTPTALQAGARAADDLGITPSLGMTGKTGAMAAAGMEKLPLSGGIIAKDATRAVGEVEATFARLRSGVGAALSPDAAGGALQSGLVKSVEAFKDRSKKLFAKVDARIPKGTKVSIGNTADLIATTKEHFIDNPILAEKLGLNQWDAVMLEAKSSGVPWQGVRQLRTKIGEAIGSNRGALADEDLGRLKSLYSALTDDMEAATKSAGNGAFGAWKAANNYYKNGASRIERSLDATITAKSPERAFEAFAALTKKDRSTSDLTRMRDIKLALSPEDWSDVSGSIVERLGQAKAGAQGAGGDTFSPGVFLTEWNKLSPEGKRLLLPEDARIEFEKLAKVAENMKAANIERNYSNTGTALGWVATVFGVASNIPTTAAALGGSALAAKSLTSPTMLKALNKAARGDTRQIQFMAKGKGPFAEDAKTVLRLMAAQNAPANDAEQPLKLAK